MLSVILDFLCAGTVKKKVNDRFGLYFCEQQQRFKKDAAGNIAWQNPGTKKVTSVRRVRAAFS